MLRIPRIHRAFNQEVLAKEPHWEKSIKPYIDTLPERLRHGHGLVFLGNYSCGKSACAAHVLDSALNYGKVGCWIRMDEIPDININDAVFDHVTGKLLSEHIQDCPLLVIDEFLVRSADNLRYMEQATEILVRRRVDNLRSTIITTNLAQSLIETRFASFSAVLEEQFKFVKFPAYDFRKDKLGRLK